MSNGVHVESVNPFAVRAKGCLEDRVSGVGGYVETNEANAACHAMDVRVYGECRFAEAEEKYARGRLRTHTMKLQQPPAGIVERHVPKVLEIDLLALRLDCAENILDARSFDIR